VELLEKELKLSAVKIEKLEKMEAQLQGLAREKAARWDAKEKELNRLIREQIESQERTRKSEAEELRAIHENKTLTLKHRI
jgi:hypothetical protein